MFYENPRQSTRARNWLKTPWNVVTAYANYISSENTTLSLKTTYVFGNRSLVWRNEDGGASAQDTIDPATNAFVPREVGRQFFYNSTTELRFAQNYKLGNQESTLAGGVRYSYASFKRQGGGEGTTNSDFDLSITGEYEYDFDFTTTNIAPFIENIFRIGNKFTITPGFRFEYLNSTVKGYKKTQETNESRKRYFPLAGIGVEFKPTANTNIYGNISQAYRPIDYSQLQPFGVTSRIDPNLKDAYGFNSDFGYRGIVKNYLNFDIGGFYMAYNNRIGVVLQTDPNTGDEYTLRTNVANSVHKGIESYLELNIPKAINQNAKFGLSIFNSLAYVDAKYTTGEYKGNRVEAAAKIINRSGLIFSIKNFTSTFQVNYVGDAYGDASNVKTSEDPAAGYIPAYTVLDFSTTYKIKNYSLKAGVNNLTDKSYFTRRADEYPGPGIIPSVGRNFYFGVSARF